MEGPQIASWETAALSKREQNAKKIPKEWILKKHGIPTTLSQANTFDIPHTSKVLNHKELKLTENYDATELVDMMSSGRVTSVEVVTAFCKRAAIAQQSVNCLTETMFEEAIARARECDEFREREGRGMGPLHGLPISLKDSFNVKGTQATIGYVAFLARPPSTTNSTLVTLLLSAGAVFYCKTNLPQTMMTADSHNNVFGRTLNPHNPSLTAGGSTGGEGALIAMHGSPLGMATDIAGSCRIPALCCGVKSFKPSAGRVPFGGGVPPGRLGSPSPIVPVIGPIGHSIRDFELFMRTVCTAETWNFDENVLSVPWRHIEPITRPLRFGVLLRGHPKRPLHPPIARALHTAAEKLKQAGHEIVPLDDKIPDIWECAILAWKYFSLDTKKTPETYLAAAGEPAIPSIAKTRFAELDGWEPSLDALFDMNLERAGVLRKWHDLYVGERLDAVVMAGFQGTAVPHDTYGVTVYTVLQNLLNYPSAILPYLEADTEDDQPLFDSEAVYEPPYNPATFAGMPAHIQIMGKPMQDEELMEILKVVDGMLAKE